MLTGAVNHMSSHPTYFLLYTATVVLAGTCTCVCKQGYTRLVTYIHCAHGISFNFQTQILSVLSYQVVYDCIATFVGDVVTITWCRYEIC